MKKVTRKQVQGFLLMWRKCLRQLKSGEVDSIDDKPVYHVEHDDYVHVDEMFNQLCDYMKENHNFNEVGTIQNLVSKLSNNENLTVSDIDAVSATLNSIETFICKTTTKKQANDIVLRVQIEDELKRLEVI